MKMNMHCLIRNVSDKRSKFFRKIDADDLESGLLQSQLMTDLSINGHPLTPKSTVRVFLL